MPISTLRQLLGCVLLGLCTSAVAKPFEVFVAPHGSDAWSGRLPEATAEGTDGPLRSLGRALAVVADHDGPRLVTLRGGRYHLAGTLVVGPAHTAGGPLRLRNFRGENPVLSGAVPLGPWRRCSLPPAGIPAAARDHLWQADVPAGVGPVYALFDGEERLPRARSAGFKPAQGPRDPERSTTALHYPAGAPIHEWPNPGDIEIIIRPWCLWTMNILPLARVDTETRIVQTALPGSYPLTRERHGRFGPASVWVENAPEALDEPGEWIFVSRDRKVHYWPPAGTPGESVAAAALAELVRVAGDEATGQPVRHLSIEGLTFTQGQRDTWTATDAGLQHDWEMYDKGNALLRFRWAEDCSVTNCIFTQSAGGGVRCDLYAQRVSVENSEFSHLGGTGVLLCGYGPGGPDVNRDNRVCNNHIHNIGQDYWHAAGIHIWQSGQNTVAHNLLHHTPYNAITVSGIHPGMFASREPNPRELQRTVLWDRLGLQPGQHGWNAVMPLLHTRANRIEFNEIHHAVEVLGDGNGIYVRWTTPGQRICSNYVHDIVAAHPASAIRMDDQTYNCLIAGNFIAHCTVAGISIKAANVVENNLVVDILGDNDPDNVHRATFQGYLKLRPSLGTVTDVPPPSHGRIERNILLHLGPDEPRFYDDTRNWSKGQVRIEEFEVDRNLLWWEGHEAFSRQHLQDRQALGVDVHGRAAPPGAVTPTQGRFHFEPSAAASEVGFEPPDVSRMGLTGAFPARLRERF